MAQALSHMTRGLQRTRTFPVKSAASFKAGQILIWNNGVTRHAATDADLGATGATTRIVGMALEDSTKDDGSTKGIVAVMLAEPGTEFLLPLYSGTPASAVPTPNGQLGTAYELRNVGGSYDSINLDATTNTKLVITDYSTEEFPTWPGKITDTAGSTTAGTTQYAYAWAEFVASSTFLGSGR